MSSVALPDGAPSRGDTEAAKASSLARLDIFTRHRQRIASAPFAELAVVRIVSGRKRVDDGMRSVELGAVNTWRSRRDSCSTWRTFPGRTASTRRSA
jgi:hypothetical protein